MSLLFAGAATAEEYTVQIGAFRHPSAGFGAAAEPFGSVSTRDSGSGLTLFEVGTFRSLGEANRVRGDLQAAGYADAFVRRANHAPRTEISGLPPVGAASSDPGTSGLERLPPELRDRVVYVDGELHVKEGDRFIPLSQYEGGRYR